MLTPRIRTVVLSALVPAVIGVWVCTSARAAAPTDDPEPPIAVVADNDITGAADDSGPTFSLTLESAGKEGGLDPGQIQQAVDAAAERAGQVGSGSVAAGAGGGEGSAAVGGSEAAVPAASTECQWRAANVPVGDPVWAGNDPAAGSLVVNTCNGPETYLYVPDSAFAGGAGAAPPEPPPPLDPAVLAQQARTELTLPSPAAHRSPPETNSDPAYGGLPYTWVGLSTFFWVDDWQPLARTVELRGVSATVTATPTGLTFDPGDGSPAVTCAGPGRPWVPADDNKPPSNGACGYTYRAVTPNGPLTATTSVQWSVSWTSNTGASGTFPASTTSTSSSFLVEQIQVVIR